ncbi:MAG: S8 family serine peptidase [Firmicutes bacterium]|nr:S8 family serine peptidase [Bacillota bacterium]
MKMKKVLTKLGTGIVAAALLTVSTAPYGIQTYAADLEKENTVQTEPVNTENGDYVILTTDIDAVKLPADGKEVVDGADKEVMIYESDLTQKQMQKLEQNPAVEVEENFFLEGSESKLEQKNAGSDEEINECSDWNYQMIHADDALSAVENKEIEISADMQAVKVAVLDSGVEMIAGIPVYGSVNLVDTEQDLPYYMNDMTGHGTAIADIIHQICPQAEIYSVRVLDRENRGRLSDVVEGIYWCIDHDIDVINMSFGTEKESEILEKAIQDASEHGIMVVGSVGNGGENANVEFPAAFDEVIAVGAVNTSAEKTEESTTGPEVEIVAPGEQIQTKSVLGLETVNSGTSMATPHVTGAAAILMLQNGEKDAEQIREALDASCNPIGEEEAYGNGLLDVKMAQELLNSGECEPSVSQNTADIVVSENAIDTVAAESTGNDVKEARPVETFEDVDYVEGRWSKDNHRNLTNNACDNYSTAQLSKEERILLKAGAAYPDETNSKISGGEKNPQWHGRSRSNQETNYIANYIFATKIAKAGGAILADSKKVNGQTQNDFNKMNQISDTKVYGRYWKNVIAEAGLDYAGADANTKVKWRKAFLYGMALHTATDVFAHSSLAYYNNTIQALDHVTNGVADTTSYPNGNRFTCAQDTAEEVVREYYCNEIGGSVDFGLSDAKSQKGFELYKVKEYARQVHDNFYDDIDDFYNFRID